MPGHLKRQYEALKKLAAKNLGSTQVANLIVEMETHAREILTACELVNLTSRVAGKSYFGFHGKTDSRPVNVDLYVHDPRQFERLVKSFLDGMPKATPKEITRTAYTMALSVCGRLSNSCLEVFA